MRTLELMQFRPDQWFLQEAVWMRNVSKLARADQFEDLPVAERLFDWTVRNIQLEPDPPSTRQYRHLPFETLLLSSGTAIDRAWVFVLLARQQGLDVVMLGLADEDGKNVRPWLPALFSGGELYLFDCRLGLPIAGPDGRGVATLKDAVADDRLLRKLDLDEQNPYPVHAVDLQHVVAFVEATPASLSRRMALVESRLTGKHKLVLASPGSGLTERLKTVPHVADAKLWPWPFQVTLGRSRANPNETKAAAQEMVVVQTIPTILSARAMYFKGKYDGSTGAKAKLLDARPPDTAFDSFRLPQEQAQRFSREVISQVEAAHIVVMKHAKQDASFWLGLITYEQQDYAAAIDWFAKRTLEATPNGRWTNGATYNLARAYEATGQLDRAIALYEADKSPQSHGNKLRARRLTEQETKSTAKASATTP